MVRKKKNSNGGGKKKSNNNKNKKSVDSQNQSVCDWVFHDSISPPASSVITACENDFGVQMSFVGKVVFELHSHTICSDGYLSPTALVQRAHRNGVNVLALTDHDTMAGIPEASEAARKLGIRMIPGVEISAIYTPRPEESGNEEPVHVLAYYGSSGPSRCEELENRLANIRDGRYIRAKNMLLKLSNLKMPLKWENVVKIAGNGVAPGRLHVARAMVEAGHVENLKQAFNRYLYDGGPAYSTGNELPAEEAVELIRQTGGVAALAHPWALKNPVGVIRRLKAAGLHGIEVYRSDGRLSAFSDLADTYGLIKLGGSDYHGKGNHDESDLGSVSLPMTALHEFLNLARPIWCDAVKSILQRFAEDPSDLNLEKLSRYGKVKNLKGCFNSSNDVVNVCLSSWLTREERQSAEFEGLRLKLPPQTNANQVGVTAQL